MSEPLVDPEDIAAAVRRLNAEMQTEGSPLAGLPPEVQDKLRQHMADVRETMVLSEIAQAGGPDAEAAAVQLGERMQAMIKEVNELRRHSGERDVDIEGPAWFFMQWLDGACEVFAKEASNDIVPIATWIERFVKYLDDVRSKKRRAPIEEWEEES
jgi:hypothetical protein